MRQVPWFVLGAMLIAAGAAHGQQLGPEAQRRLLVSGNTLFACELLKKLAAEHESGNLAFSPLSVSLAMGMTHAGARGDTAAEMAKALQLPTRGVELESAFGNLTASLAEHPADAPYTMLLANRLWVQQDRSLLPEFLNATRQAFRAEAATLDFAGNPEGARGEINQWIEEQTRDQIRDLLPSGSISSRTALVLTNALYFKGEWTRPFDPTLTGNQPFHLSTGETVDVAMMHNPQLSVRYAKARDVEVLELAYRGDRVVMRVFLPSAEYGIQKLVETLSTPNLEGVDRVLQPKLADVTIPKFKIQLQQSLVAPLQASGVKLAFTTSADFSGIDGTQNLYLTDVVHGCVVDVNETGTVAAAATAAVVGVKSALPGADVTFRADRPFLFLLRDTVTGSILFVGRVTNPAK